MKAWTGVLLWMCLAFSASAQPASDPSPLRYRDRAEEVRFHTLTAELRCVQCQNQSLADSDAQIAHDMRREVLKLIHEGHSDAEIKQFLVERYGEFVLYRPQLEASTALLWFGPGMLLLTGAVLLIVYVRRRGRAVPVASNDDASQEEREW